jgi:hypothetical protein
MSITTIEFARTSGGVLSASAFAAFGPTPGTNHFDVAFRAAVFDD